MVVATLARTALALDQSAALAEVHAAAEERAGDHEAAQREGRMAARARGAADRARALARNGGRTAPLSTPARGREAR